MASPQSPRQPELLGSALCLIRWDSVLKVFPARPSLFGERESSRNDLSVPSFEGTAKDRRNRLLFHLPFTPGVSRKLH